MGRPRRGVPCGFYEPSSAEADPGELMLEPTSDRSRGGDALPRLHGRLVKRAVGEICSD